MLRRTGGAGRPGGRPGRARRTARRSTSRSRRSSGSARSRWPGTATPSVLVIEAHQLELAEDGDDEDDAAPDGRHRRRAQRRRRTSTRTTTRSRPRRAARAADPAVGPGLRAAGRRRSSARAGRRARSAGCRWTRPGTSARGRTATGAGDGATAAQTGPVSEQRSAPTGRPAGCRSGAPWTCSPRRARRARPAGRRLQRHAVLRGRPRRRHARPASTSRSRASGRCGTSPTARWPRARWRRTWCPRRPAGTSCRRPCCATGRSGRAWCQLLDRRRRDGRPRVAGPQRPPGPAPDGGARRRDQQRRPQGRPPAADDRTGTSTASTTASASTSRTSCARCCGSGAATPLTDEARRRCWSALRDDLRRPTSATGSASCSTAPEVRAHPPPGRPAAAHRRASRSRRATGRPSPGRRSERVRVALPRIRRGVESWPLPDGAPRLPGSGAPAAGPRHRQPRGPPASPPGPVARMYVCGITPYDATHLGHAATYVDLRPAAAGCCATPATRSATSRTSPTSTTRCSSGRPRPAWTGRELAAARDRAVPRGHGGAAGAAAATRTSARSRRSRRSWPAGRSGCATAGQAYDVDGDLYFSVDSDERFGSVSRPGPRADARAVRRARRRPRPAGQEGPARLPALAGRAAGRAGLGQPVRAGPARLAHRVHGDRAATTSAMAFDVQGGGSDLVFPHHEMGASEAQVLTGRVAVRPGVRARRHGRPRRREDVEVPGQPRLRLAAARGRRRPDGDPAGAARATTTAATGSGPPRTSTAATERLARWRAGVPPPSGPPARAAARRTSASALADDLDAPRALAAVDRWVEEQRLRGGSDPRHRHSSATPSTPCSASPSDCPRQSRRDHRRVENLAGGFCVRW